MRRVVRTAAVAALVAAAGLTGGGAQAAVDDGNGLLRLAHLSPDTPAVDVYVDAVADPDAGITLEGVGYGTVSDYRDVPPGEYTISVREAGASEDTPPVLSTTVAVEPDRASTVAGVGLFSDLGLEIIEDDLQTPPADRARVRVLAGAAGAETLDVVLGDGTIVAEDLGFAGASDYVDVPAGAATLSLAAAGGDPTEVRVDLAAGSVYSLLVLDGAEGLSVRPVLDAAGPGVVPQGGVDAGAGGTAADAPVGPILLGAGAVLVVAGAAVARASGSRPRHAAPRR